MGGSWLSTSIFFIWQKFTHHRAKRAKQSNDSSHFLSLVSLTQKQEVCAARVFPRSSNKAFLSLSVSHTYTQPHTHREVGKRKAGHCYYISPLTPWQQQQSHSDAGWKDGIVTMRGKQRHLYTIHSSDKRQSDNTHSVCVWVCVCVCVWVCEGVYFSI